MTKDEIMELDLDGIEARKAEMRTEIENASDSAALDAIETEKGYIEERIAQIREEVETRKADMQTVVENPTPIVIEKPMEERKMTELEIRGSKEYIDAFAKYLKTGRDAECRALLSMNATSGQVPVPTYAEDRIKTAWDRVELMNLVRKTYIRGNLNVGFEKSATGAFVHTEGSAVGTASEETLTLGIVELKPESIKKWINREVA